MTAGLFARTGRCSEGLGSLAAGTTYTVEVTSPTANVTGAFTLTVTITPDLAPVNIIGLADAYGTGQTTATASDDFTVDPADA